MAPSLAKPDAAPTDGEQLISAVLERSELIGQLARIHVESGLYGHDEELKKSLEPHRAELSSRISRLNAVIRDVGGVIKDA